VKQSVIDDGMDSWRRRQMSPCLHSRHKRAFLIFTVTY